MKKTIILLLCAILSACAAIKDDSKGYPTIETDLALMNIEGVV